LLGFQNFEQKDGWEGKYEDRVIYNMKKFFLLALENNPTILEFLYLPQECILTSSHSWNKIVENRNIFISKKAKHTFTGYAHSQLQRIKRHRGYLLNPIKEEPKRENFGLPKNPTLPKEQLNAILVLPDDLAKDLYKYAEKERQYREAKLNWDNYISWEKGRNPARAEMERKWGFDVKHASHLVRLMKEGEELLITGKITLPRPEVDLLKRVKNGYYSYDELIEMVENFDHEFEKLYLESSLPHTPDHKKAQDLYLEILDKKCLDK
jgi:predicted nucleotidyltransferase